MSDKIEGVEDVKGGKDKQREWLRSFLGAHLAVKHGDDADALREAQAAKNLKGAEDRSNEGRAVDAMAHGLSGHGPGTDQTPRLVSGRRADEVARTAKDGSDPAEKVTLTRPTSTREVPKHTTVGSDPSNISSRFHNATMMQEAIEEALAQATLLQSRIAKEVKTAADDRQVLELPAVKGALVDLVKARKAHDQAEADLKGAWQNSDEDAWPAALEQAQKAKPALEKAMADFIEEKKKAMAALPKLAPSKLGDQRIGLTVSPGGALNKDDALSLGESFAVTGDTPALKEGEALSEATMQDRFSKISRTRDVKQARVILDPAMVKDKDGVEHRAGWQVQTAFPAGPEDITHDLTDKDYQLLRAKEPVTEAEKDEKRVHNAYEAVVKKKVELNATLLEQRAQRDKAKNDAETIEPAYYPDKWREAPELNLASAEKQAEKFAELKKNWSDMKLAVAKTEADIKKVTTEEAAAKKAWAAATNKVKAATKTAEAKVKAINEAVDPA